MAMKPNPSDPKEEITLVPYRWEWEKLYAKEKKLLETELGEHVLDIGHIGSTAIPDMSARPIIDILIGIEDLSEIAGFEGTLNDMGYHRSTLVDESQHALFEADGRQAYALHFVKAWSLKDTSHARFRNLLIADKKLAKEYKELKIKLARKHPLDLRRYSEEKGRWIQAVLKA